MSCVAVGIVSVKINKLSFSLLIIAKFWGNNSTPKVLIRGCTIRHTCVVFLSELALFVNCKSTCSDEETPPCELISDHYMVNACDVTVYGLTAVTCTELQHLAQNTERT